MIYAVINTMSAIPNDSIGTVISTHRTEEMAKHSAKASQPRERGSYLPTRIVVLRKRLPRGRHVGRADVADWLIPGE